MRINLIPSAQFHGAPQYGYSLIEVLIAVIVLSVGLLGLAGLQIANLQNTNSAGQRFEATNLAYDILERMRANRTAAITGKYNVAIGGSLGGGTQADQDVTAWKSALQILPNGDGAITVNNSIATVTVQWTEPSNSTATYYLRSQL